MTTSSDIIFALEKATKNTLNYLNSLQLSENELTAAKLAISVFIIFFSEVVNND